MEIRLSSIDGVVVFSNGNLLNSLVLLNSDFTSSSDVALTDCKEGANVEVGNVVDGLRIVVVFTV